MSDLLTFCACIDPRRISPATGHYPGCPDEIIPPDQLLPPWEVVTHDVKDWVGKGARTEKYPNGTPIYEWIRQTELVPGRAWTQPWKAPAPVASIPAASPVETSDAPDTDSVVVVLDTETTGINDPRVCEIALCVIDLSSSGDPRVIARHAKLLNPGKAIEPSAVRVHGITDADVRDCPTLADVWEKLVAWVEKYAGREPQIIAHNAPFDRRAITGSLPLLPGDLPPWHWRCSLALAKKVAPGLPSYSLHDDPSKGKVGLATSLKLVKGESHRAMGDVITTISLLGALRARAGAWTSWRGEAVSWAGKAAAEAVEKPWKPADATESAPVALPKPAPPTIPAAFGRPVRKPARAVPSGPSLFDRIVTKEPA